jgi:hypothetical protein
VEVIALPQAPLLRPLLLLLVHLAILLLALPRRLVGYEAEENGPLLRRLVGYEAEEDGGEEGRVLSLVGYEEAPPAEQEDGCRVLLSLPSGLALGIDAVVLQELLTDRLDDLQPLLYHPLQFGT